MSEPNFKFIALGDTITPLFTLHTQRLPFPHKKEK